MHPEVAAVIGHFNITRRWVDKKGYVRLSVTGRYPVSGQFFEHRLVMETLVGRVLTIKDHVHHRNLIRADNRPSNLHLLAASKHIGDHNKTRAKNRGTSR